jgi:predicted metal-dependent phosphoesterase TrpH
VKTANASKVFVDMNQENRILFERPDIGRLADTYTVVDLHFHSKYSDGQNTIQEIAEYAEALGIGVAITDHNDIQGAVEIAQYSRIFTIPGIEVTSREGAHILFYFYEIKELRSFYHRDVAPHMGKDIMSSTDLSLEALIQRANRYSVLSIFPHPFCGMYTGIASHQLEKQHLTRLFQLIDGIEVINSENLNKWNLKSALLGFNLNKAISGGSDGHSLSQLGKVVSYADCEPTCKAFLDAIKHKQNKVVGKESDILKKVKSNGIKLRTNLKNYPDIVEKNFSYSRKVINIKSRLLRDRVRDHINGKRKRFER